MPPFLKNKFRGLISSVLPMSIRHGLGSTAGSKAVPLSNISMAIVVWVQLITALLRPWSTESEEVWAELNGYHIHHLYLCKNGNTCEHEFIVAEMVNEQKQKLQLRVERSAGERKDSESTSSPSSSLTSFDMDSDDSPSPPPSPSTSHSPGPCRRRSSQSSLSIVDGFSKTTSSVRHAFRRLSEGSLSRPSGISSNGYFAADTVIKIDSFPKKTKVIRTIEFNSADRSQRPSLWDLMILSYVIHKDSATYELFDRQCFWFADTISALLEKWSEITVRDTSKPTKSRFLTRNASSGSVKGVTVHRRSLEDIEKIWAQFLDEREEMNQKRQEFEDNRTDEAKRAEELERQVDELRKQQDKERREREKERRERDKEREEREERERQLKQKIVNQERVQQQLQQQLEENDRRFQEIEQMIQMLNGSSSQLNTPLSLSRCHSRN